MKKERDIKREGREGEKKKRDIPLEVNSVRCTNEKVHCRLTKLIII